MKNIEKPFFRNKEVTYEMINTHKYFRNITLDALQTIIGSMNYNGYVKLRGSDSSKKGEILFNKFKKTKTNKMKPTLNKKAVEKVKELQEKVKVTPLKDFEGWAIGREGGKIAFGCGEVTLTRPRMLKYAAILANPLLVKKLSGVEEKIAEYKETVKDNFNYPSTYSELTLKELKNWVALLEDKEIISNLKFLKELSNDTGNRYSVEDLLDLSYKTVLGIIG